MPQPWWERRETIFAVILLSALPLLWPDIPPLTDLPGHMGRYRVQLDLDRSEALQRFYTFNWALIGNLGVDLLVVPLARLLGLELAVKLIAISIPPLTVGGLFWIAREVHGRIPPTAFFAMPFAYGFPFLFGFLNFALSMALALLAFAFWLRLARLGRLKLRAALFVPISLGLWVTHAFGWGALGLLAFSAELGRQRDLDRSWLNSALQAAVHCLALAPPISPMLLWRGGQIVGATEDWLNWRSKLASLIMVLRDRWQTFDLAALAVACVVIFAGWREQRLEFSRNLAASALLLAAAFILLPRIVFGSAYADMRLAPYALAIAIIAIRMAPQGKHTHLAGRIALTGLAFLMVRMGAHTVSFYLYDREFDREVAAIEHVPEGARLVSFVGAICDQPWAMSRKDHLPAMALVRRRAFSNDQWAVPGAQLLRIRNAEAGRFSRDPSQMVTRHPCPTESWLTLDQALDQMPREAFDFVWLIDPPSYDARLREGLRPVWRSKGSILFAVEDQAPPDSTIATSEMPNGSGTRPIK